VCEEESGTCVEGCYGAGARNGCPEGLFCSSPDAYTLGRCSEACALDSHCRDVYPSTPVCSAQGNGRQGCVECSAHAHCAGREDGRTACLGRGSTCAQCSAADTSRCDVYTVGGACLSTGLCGCRSDADCSAEQVCDISTQRCEPCPEWLLEARRREEEARRGPARTARSCSSAPLSEPLAVLLLLGLRLAWPRRRT
jgi:hypothetical protein